MSHLESALTQIDSKSLGEAKTMMKPRVKIRVTGTLGNGLMGYVIGHPNWPEETEHGPVWTSQIVARHPNGDIETENTIYEVVS